jgi:hypothetical protein
MPHNVIKVLDFLKKEGQVSSYVSFWQKRKIILGLEHTPKQTI